MTRYNTKTQKAMWKRIVSTKIGKGGNGNVFQNLIKTVANLFEEKKHFFFN